MSRLDSKIDTLDAKIGSKIEALNAKMDRKFDNVHADLKQIDSKVSNLEGQITQMGRSNIVPFSPHHKGDAQEN